MSEDTPLMRNIFIGILMGFTIIVGSVAFMAKLQDADNRFMSADELRKFNTTFAQYNTIESDADVIRGNLEDTQAATDKDTLSQWLGISEALVKSAWSSVKFIFGSITLTSNLLIGLGTYLFLPAWATGAIVTSIVITIIFTVLYFVFKVKQ